MITTVSLLYSGFLPGNKYSLELLTNFIQMLNYININIPYKILSESKFEFLKIENSYFTGKNYGDL